MRLLASNEVYQFQSNSKLCRRSGLQQLGYSFPVYSLPVLYFTYFWTFYLFEPFKLSTILTARVRKVMFSVSLSVHIRGKGSTSALDRGSLPGLDRGCFPQGLDRVLPPFKKKKVAGGFAVTEEDSLVQVMLLLKGCSKNFSRAGELICPIASTKMDNGWVKLFKSIAVATQT